MTMQPPPGAFMTTQPPPGAFMTTQPPPGAMKRCQSKQINKEEEEERTLLDLSTRHFEDALELKKRKIGEIERCFGMIGM